MLKTKIANVDLDCCLYNASGPRTGSIEALTKVGSSRSGAILSKSSTLVKQDGNQLPRFLNKIKLGSFCEGSMNSEGLPNAGFEYYISPDAIEQCTKYAKPYIVSLSGLSLDDNIVMLERILQTEGVTAIELNLACPNIPGKPVIAYDFEQMEEVLQRVTSCNGFGLKPIGIKLAPYFDIPHFDKVAAIVAKYPINFVVTINTIGNALFVDADAECASISPKGGFGGLGGGYVKPTALANVRQLYQKFLELGRLDIDIIGVGGISTGKDAFEMILCGAKAVQIGTCHWTEGPSCFERIARELEAIMRAKGYSSIEDFRGRLKPYEKHINRWSTSDIGSGSGSGDEQAKEHSTTVSTDTVGYLAVIAVLIAVIAYLLYER